MYIRILTLCVLNLCILCPIVSGDSKCKDDSTCKGDLPVKKAPAPDSHRCGVCPTYFQKICAFSFDKQATYIFDNHCIMDLYNCFEGTDFIPLNYEHCLYFGNFAHVHGLKFEDLDYDEKNIHIVGSVKNPDHLAS